MKSIFEPDAYQAITDRVEKLTPESQAKWGKMNVAQMMAHCNKAMGTFMGDIPAEGKPNFLLKLLFKKSLYNDKPYRKNLPTGKGLAISDPKEFDKERTQMLDYLGRAHKRGLDFDWAPHPAFGQYTSEQNGKAIYKHTDHHLQQFGV